MESTVSLLILMNTIPNAVTMLMMKQPMMTMMMILKKKMMMIYMTGMDVLEILPKNTMLFNPI
jgi:hypothetical protein